MHRQVRNSPENLKDCLEYVNMPPTVRQTDKATWWSITAFDDEIAILESPEQYPDWVKTIHGGREQCPETGRVHFQGALQCNNQARFAQIKKWLPTSHIEAARASEALRKYVMKTDTAVGEKVVRTTTKEYWTMERALVEIGSALRITQQTYHTISADPKAAYWLATSYLIAREPFRIQQLSIPNLEKAFARTYQVWIREDIRALVLQPETGTAEEGPEFVEFNSPPGVSNDASPPLPSPPCSPSPPLQD